MTPAHTRRVTGVAALSAAVIIMGLAAGAGAAAGRSSNKARAFTTEVSGGWAQAACVPVEPPTIAEGRTQVALVCEMAYSGTWTADVVEFIEGELAEDGSFAGTNDYFIGGRAPAENTCGWLHVREQVTSEAPPSGSSRGAGEILSGTGDWVGSRGSAFISGAVLGGGGVGGYSGTWTRPLPPSATADVPCAPGPPPAELAERLADAGLGTRPLRAAAGGAAAGAGVA